MAAETKRKSAAPRKASSPRKKAEPQTNGLEPNGEVLDLPSVLVQPDVEHPYDPGTPVFAFYPTDGSPPIVFPKMITVDIDAKFLWSIYNLNELYQSFEWMNRAGVPRIIQERVIDLPLADRQKFWSSWFGEVADLRDKVKADTAGPPGESER